MADSVVTFLLENLTELFSREANLLVGVKDQVSLLHNKLKFIEIFIVEKRNEHDKVNEVVNQIIDVAHEAEDVIDTFIAHVTKQEMRGRLKKLFRPFDHLKMLHGVAKKIKNIKTTIDEIYENKAKFGIEGTESTGRDVEMVESLDKRRRKVEEKDVVGFFEDTERLVEQLVKGDLRRDAVSIFGMAGLGKTTLARKIYKDNRINKYFDCRAWVYVSQEYTTRELLLGILSCLMPNIEEKRSMSDDQLKEKLYEFLEKKKYLIVMDDVWTIDVWNEVGDAFPDKLNGSRILITSRKYDVGVGASSITLPYSLQFLNEDESWELFSKKVFRGEKCPPDLETCGKQIVEKCRGFRLSIVVLGGLLSVKEKTKRTWSKYIDNVNCHLTECVGILALSYNHLPRHLKPCFLYFGIYPEDFTIPVRQLIQLWIAEGFIQHTSNRNMEDVAEDYLEELIDRSLIQVASRRTDGGVKTCRIHDLLREFCISESTREKFLEVHSEVNKASMSKSRRLAIHIGIHQNISFNPPVTSSFRSFLCFGEDTRRFRFDTKHWNWLLKSFKLVRVADLRYVISNSIPNKIENLVLLRYLRIGWNERVIPDSICNLRNLETLDMRDSPTNCLPRGIWKLQKLRNLYLYGPTSLPKPWGTEGKDLSNLQVLSGISPNEQTRSLIVNAGFPNVKRLRLCCTSTPNESKGKEQEVLKNLHCLLHLQTLTIIEHCELPSRPNSLPSTLTKITLVRMYLSSSAMVMLGSLPNLEILKLRGSPSDRSMVNLNCIGGGFSELQFLQMDELEIKKWNLGSGAMPRLRHLIIKDCKNLEMLPAGELRSMTALRKVEVIWPSQKLMGTLKGLQMKDECELLVVRDILVLHAVAGYGSFGVLLLSCSGERPSV